MVGFHVYLDLHNQQARTVTSGIPIARPPMVGPKEVRMQLPGGTVTVYLPHQMATGDFVSGSVFPSSAGDWNTQHQNLTYLSSLYLRIGDKKISIADIAFSFTVDSLALAMDVEDSSGRVLAQSAIDLSQPDPEVPSNDAKVVQAGKPIGLAGRFDGDRDRTFASFNSHPIGILAEGSSECYITAPSDWLGAAHFRVAEKDQVINERLSVVSLTFLAPGTPTIAGRKTSIGIEVEGLRDADPSVFPVVVEMTVDSPKVARFSGPDAMHGTLLVFPSDLADGHVLKSVPIKARGNGNYSITARVF